MPVLYAATVLTLALGISAAGGGPPADATDIIVLARADGGKGGGQGAGKGGGGDGGLGGVGGLGGGKGDHGGGKGGGKGGDGGAGKGGGGGAGKGNGQGGGKGGGPGGVGGVGSVGGVSGIGGGGIGGGNQAGNQGGGTGASQAAGGGGDRGGSSTAGHQADADRGSGGAATGAAPSALDPAGAGIGGGDGSDRAGAGRLPWSQPQRARLDPSAGGWVCPPGHRRIGMRCEPTTAATGSAQRGWSLAATDPAAPATEDAGGGPAPAAGPAATPGDDARPAYGPDMIRAVQESLLALGFRPGPVDGMFGPQTRSALQSYQRANGLPEDGRLSELLIARILAAGLQADLQQVR